MKTITIKTPSLEGKIHIGADVFERRLKALTAGQKNIVLTDGNVFRLYEPWLKKYFAAEEIVQIEAVESNKEFSMLQGILTQMLALGLTRNSRLFAVGGGVIGDMGGLAAALYMRGISYVQIPTTLLAQVDSGVGGKTAVNLDGVKNVVGAFYQPDEVLVSPEFLRTLSASEIKCGLGEIVKYAMLNEEIFDAIENNLDKLGDLDFLSSLTEKCIYHKARTVEKDEKEKGERKSLNAGHTTGHAIELLSGLSHGESVLYGLLAEMKIAMAKGVCEKEYGERLLKIITRALEIPPYSAYDFSAVDAIAENAKSDKKNAGDGKICMVVAKNKGEWTVLPLSFEEYKQSLTEQMQ